MNPITQLESTVQAGISTADLKHATLSQAQEAEIAAKLAKAASLDLPTFAERSLKVKAFCEWYEKRFEAIPALEKITDDKRAAFMTFWEEYLRKDATCKNYEAYIDELLATEPPPSSDDALPEYRRDAVQHDRENEDGGAPGDDDDGEDDDEDPDPAPAPSYASRSVQTAPPPPSPPPTPFTQKDGEDIRLSDNDPRESILAAWCAKFAELPYVLQDYWRTTRGESLVMGGKNLHLRLVWLDPWPGVTIKPAIAAHPVYQQFDKYTERTRRMLAAYVPQAAQDLDDIEAASAARYVVPGLIPYGLTVFHGDEGACKSLFLQKLALAVSDKDGAEFEGDVVEHGQVIYATLDPNASPAAVKPGLRAVRDRLGLQASGRLALVGPPLLLNHPSSVARWLELNAARLPCKMIVVDSLFSAVSDGASLAQDTVMGAAVRGVEQLLAECDAVAMAHHDTKTGDIFGSVYLKPMVAAAATVVRPFLKDGRRGDKVAITVTRMKFDTPTRKLAYTLEGPFLDLTESTGALSGARGVIDHADLLAQLPLTARPIKGTRPEGMTEKAWWRLREQWEAAGLIEQKGGTIRLLS